MTADQERRDQQLGSCAVFVVGMLVSLFAISVMAGPMAALLFLGLVLVAVALVAGVAR